MTAQHDNIRIEPNNWKLIDFNEAYTFLRSYSLSRKQLTVKSNTHSIYNIHYGDIHARFPKPIIDIDKVSIPVILNESFKYHNEDLLREGDLVISDVSEDMDGVGEAVELKNVRTRKVLAGLHTFAVRDTSGLTVTGFRGYIFQNQVLRNEMRKISTGISVHGISKTNISKLKIPIPPLPQQRKIAKILSTWDRAIERVKKLIELKQELKKGLMQQLLTGKKRLPGFEGEWETVRLGDLFDERIETGFTDKQLLSLGEHGVFPQSQSNRKDTSNKDKSKYKRICPGDIGYNTMRMWQGRSAYSDMEGIVSPAYTVIKPVQNIHSRYFSYLFKMSKSKHSFYRNSQALVSNTLNCKYRHFSKIKMTVPTLKDEQKAISNLLELFDREKITLESKLELLQHQKKGLMQQLLTGKKRVAVDYEEGGNELGMVAEE